MKEEQIKNSLRELVRCTAKVGWNRKSEECYGRGKFCTAWDDI
jgi:hypothetical protein